MFLTLLILLMVISFPSAFPESVNLDNEISTEVKLHRKDLKDLCPKLTCGTPYIEVTFTKSELVSWGLDTRSIHLEDSTCYELLHNNIVITIKWRFGVGTCGNILSKTEKNVTYKNVIHLPPNPSETVYREDVFVNVSCTYPLDMNVSLGTVLRPIISLVEINIEGTGTFVVKMAVYKDASYSTPYEDGEVKLSTTSTLYVGVFISEGDTSLFDIVMKNCFATPTNNIYDAKKYYIIEDGCPNKKDGTIQVAANGISAQGQFSVQMFKFIGDYSRVFLHCEVYLCDKKSSCLPSCSKVRTLAATPDTQGFLHIGPITRDDSIIPDSVGKQTYLGLMTLAGFVITSYLFL